MSGLEQALGAAFQRLQTSGKKLCCEQVGILGVTSCLLFAVFLSFGFFFPYQITTAIASVADAAQDLFTDFYDRLVPHLKFILVNCTADEHKVCHKYFL